MNTTTDIAAYTQLLINPIDSAPCSIPDEDPTPHALKTLNYNQNLTIAQPNGLFVWPSHSESVGIRHYGYDPVTATCNLLGILLPDEDVTSNYIKGRSITGGLQLISNTVAGGAFAVSGALSAIAYGSLPPIDTISPSSLTQYKMDNVSVLGSVPSAEGVVVVAPITDTRKYRYFATKDNMTYGFANMLEFGGPDHFLSQYAFNPLVPVAGLPQAVLFDSDATPNFLPSPKPWGNYHATLSMEVTPSAVAAINNVTLEITTATADPATYAQILTTRNWPINAVQTVGPAYRIALDLYDYVPAEIVRVRLLLNSGIAVNWTFGLSSALTLEFLDYTCLNFKEPGIIIAYASVSAGQQMSLMGKSHWEVVPNFNLSRNLPTFYNIDDPMKLEAAMLFIIMNYGTKFRFVYGRLDFFTRMRAGEMEPTAQNIVYHASTVSQKFLVLLKTIGSALARPGIAALGTGLGLISGNPMLGAAASNAGLLLYDGWRGEPPPPAPYRASTSLTQGYTLEDLDRYLDNLGTGLGFIPSDPFPPPPYRASTSPFQTLCCSFETSQSQTQSDDSSLVSLPSIDPETEYSHYTLEDVDRFLTIPDSEFGIYIPPDDPDLLAVLSQEIPVTTPAQAENVWGEVQEAHLSRRPNREPARYRASTGKVSFAQALAKKPALAPFEAPQPLAVPEVLVATKIPVKDRYASAKADCFTMPTTHSRANLIRAIEQDNGGQFYTAFSFPLVDADRNAIGASLVISHHPVKMAGATTKYVATPTSGPVIHMDTNILEGSEQFLRIVERTPNEMFRTFHNLYVTIVPWNHEPERVDGTSWMMAAILAWKMVPDTVFVSGNPAKGQYLTDLQPKAALGLAQNRLMFFVNPEEGQCADLEQALEAHGSAVKVAPYALRYDIPDVGFLCMPENLGASLLSILINEAIIAVKLGLTVSKVTGTKTVEQQTSAESLEDLKDPRQKTSNYEFFFDPDDEYEDEEGVVRINYDTLSDIVKDLEEYDYARFDPETNIWNRYNAQAYRTLARYLDGALNYIKSKKQPKSRKKKGGTGAPQVNQPPRVKTKTSGANPQAIFSRFKR